MITVLRLAAVAIIFVSLTLALLPVQLLAIRAGHDIRRRLPRRWHRIMAPALGLKVEVIGKPAADRPLMLASNHVSWKDIVVLGAVADVVYVAKSEVRDWPVFGWLARLQRSVFVERERRRTTGDQIGEMAKRLKAGEIVVLFPEGTTSDGNRTLPFKTSLFGAATAAIPEVPEKRVTVQPVAICYVGVHGMPMGRYHRPIAAWPGDVALGPHLFRVLREGALEVEVRFGEPVMFDETTNRKAAAKLIETRIAALLAEGLAGRKRIG
ncbi:MAG: 1-acyl-sn-glycerol-3-phosphate acyltransferase [Rhizobiales bacterium]|nr:1-acyl-sn-glycerol-3-phosphate acyltransferase [Hyphomicrobiales bacterium]MBA67814.1 1-acyl-sn-glycerol-3-phosphate acyltransferase [Hyphomicrobiales bacterium]